MVQAVENWTCVTGTVVAVKQDAEHGRLLLHLRLEEARAAKGFASLLKSKPNDVLAIALAAGWSGGALPEGLRVTLPVRMARGPALFAHPEWRPGKPSPLC